MKMGRDRRPEAWDGGDEMGDEEGTKALRLHDAPRREQDGWICQVGTGQAPWGDGEGTDARVSQTPFHFPSESL